MNGEAPAQSVILITVASAVGLILLLFVGGLLAGRHLKIKTRNLAQITVQEHELSKEQRELLSRWRQIQTLLGLVVLLLVIAAVLNYRWYWGFGVLLYLPIGIILYGFQVRQTRYALVDPPFRPMRLLTGEEAVRHGNRLIALGVVLLIPCVLLALSYIITLAAISPSQPASGWRSFA